MLAKAGLDMAALECGTHWPYNEAAQRALAREGAAPSALHNNCSGKHAGFDLGQTACGTDGCSIPTFAIPLRHLAHAFAKVTSGQGLSADHARAAKRLRQAIATAPFMVAGSGRLDTRLMAHFGERLCCNVGAEGVYCAAAELEWDRVGAAAHRQPRLNRLPRLELRGRPGKIGRQHTKSGSMPDSSQG